MTTSGCIALWGDFSGERLSVGLIGDEFNLPVRSVFGMGDLTRLSRETGVVAVLVHPATLGMSWREALRRVRRAAPQARVAICHGVDTAGAHSEMTDAGAFGTLFLPLVRTEVRHFLGFVWAALPEVRRTARETVTGWTREDDAQIAC
jgi:hypothetical protein